MTDPPATPVPHRPRRSAKAWLAVVIAFAALPVVGYVLNRSSPKENPSSTVVTTRP